ncbi:class I SAM-dependent methyltransferase [Bifidobacterium leontopitheci]|uniref:Acetyltransferase family protein n=1 Tax=Bifidobacterium leontopitheci TaxID=2650774 RepID=A0A6I1GTS0_9BIFI|nr:class I SAM-dependent methyltransferase [Bifidobacterium leontopitheci]KAB7789851.1 acetyltransferase family protein [Bifidobacterium leontopitheci]
MSERTLFHGKAQAYADARPGYPDAAVRHIAALIGDGTAVADVGAGTGKLAVPIARHGLRRGLAVRAVEPDSDMRSVLLDVTRPYPNVTVVDGSAEHTTLPDHSVDAVVCAQALHWFDHDSFLAECRRICRGGRFLLVSVYNVTSFDSAMTIRHGFGAAASACAADGAAGDVNASGSAAASAISPDVLDGIGVSARHCCETTAAFFRRPTVRRFPNPIRYTRDSWRTYMDSHSHSPLPDDPSYAAYRAWVDAIFDERNVDGIMVDDTVTVVVSELLPAERG